MTVEISDDDLDRLAAEPVDEEVWQEIIRAFRNQLDEWDGMPTPEYVYKNLPPGS